MTAYQLAWEKKRTHRSLLAAFLMHCVIIGGLILYNLLFAVHLEDFSGPVLIKLGEPEGVELPLPPVPAESIEPEKETIPETVDVPADAPVPQENDSPAETASPLPEKPAEIPDRQLPEQTDPVPAEKSAAPETVVQEKPAEPEPVVIKGSENGNAHETVFSNEGGDVGRNVYKQISWFMPLPVDLDKQYIENLKGDALNSPDDYRKILLRYYQENPVQGGYILSPDVSDTMSYEERYSCWSLLENGGYDLSDAEYKHGRVLRPVVIQFTIVPDSQFPKDAKILKSSGYSDLDDAVLHGFLVSEYYNSTDRKIKGRFTYRFD